MAVVMTVVGRAVVVTVAATVVEARAVASCQSRPARPRITEAPGGRANARPGRPCDGPSRRLPMSGSSVALLFRPGTRLFVNGSLAGSSVTVFFDAPTRNARCSARARRKTARRSKGSRSRAYQPLDPAASVDVPGRPRRRLHRHTCLRSPCRWRASKFAVAASGIEIARRTNTRCCLFRHLLADLDAFFAVVASSPPPFLVPSRRWDDGRRRAASPYRQVPCAFLCVFLPRSFQPRGRGAVRSWRPAFLTRS